MFHTQSINLYLDTKLKNFSRLDLNKIELGSDNVAACLTLLDKIELENNNFSV